jgi:uncharacterized protein (TIGR03435 family)
MKKPLHKNPIFWGVILLAVAAIDYAQVQLVRQWISARVAAMDIEGRPAPGGRRVAGGGQRPAYKAKPGEWQVPQHDPSILANTPPQVTIVPTKFPGGTSSWSMWSAAGAIGIGVPLQSIFAAAYQWPHPARTILPEPAPKDRYDFIANLPTGALEGLQQEIRKKLGYTAAHETREVDALLLTVNHPDAPDLKPMTTPGRTQMSRNVSGMFQMSSAPMSALANYLENTLHTAVIDRTGLRGNYEIQFPFIRPSTPGQRLDAAGRLELTRKEILDHLGLDLTATNMDIDVLVVSKVN